MSNSSPPLSFPKGGRKNTVYKGRFAPSPTGPLHFGSLVTAVASYCDAKAHHGQWIVRIEDTDIPRIYPDSEQHILKCLDAFGFQSDVEIVYQRHRLDIYQSVIEQLKQNNLVYACECTRKILGSNHIYAGTCRDKQLGLRKPSHSFKSV